MTKHVSTYFDPLFCIQTGRELVNFNGLQGESVLTHISTFLRNSLLISNLLDSRRTKPRRICSMVIDRIDRSVAGKFEEKLEIMAREDRLMQIT